MFDILALEVEGGRGHHPTLVHEHAGPGLRGSRRRRGRRHPIHRADRQPRFDRIEGRPGRARSARRISTWSTRVRRNLRDRDAPSADGLTVELALEGARRPAAAPGSSAKRRSSISPSISTFAADSSRPERPSSSNSRNSSTGTARSLRAAIASRRSRRPTAPVLRGHGAGLLEIFDLDLVGEFMVATRSSRFATADAPASTPGSIRSGSRSSRRSGSRRSTDSTVFRIEPAGRRVRPLRDARGPRPSPSGPFRGSRSGRAPSIASAQSGPADR